jgi:hypothetical protein
MLKKMPAYAHSLSLGKRGTDMATAPSTFQNPSSLLTSVSWFFPSPSNASFLAFSFFLVRHSSDEGKPANVTSEKK